MKRYVMLSGIISAIGIILVINKINLIGAFIFSIGGLNLLVFGMMENRSSENSPKTTGEEK